MSFKFSYQKLPIGRHDPKKPLIPRPYIPVYLIGPQQETKSPYYALLDSGADRVIFPEELAKAIGIEDITKNARLEPTLGIASQKLDVYYHSLSLRVLGEARKLPTEIGFAHNLNIPILGRSFFKHYTIVAFKESKEEVEFKL